MSFTQLPCKEPLQVTRAKSYVGKNEKKDAKFIYENFQKYVGIGKNDSWCAGFVSKCLEGIYYYKSALARNFITKRSIRATHVLKGLKTVPPGSLVIWGKGNTWKGHIGIVEKWDKNGGYTIEGNTSSTNKGNQSNGDGVYRKYRKIEPFNYFRITHFTVIE